MSNTPRTDAAILTEPYQVRELGFEVVKSEDMAAMERELAQVKLERDNARKDAETLAYALEWASIW